MPESLSRSEAINAAKIADYWHRAGYLWVKTWLQPDGFCRSNVRFVSGGRGPVERKPAMHPAIKES